MLKTSLRLCPQPFLSVQSLHANIAIPDRAARIVALESESAFTEFPCERVARLNTRRLVVLENLFAIDQHRHTAIFNDDFLRPPFPVLRRRLRDVDHAIKAAGLDPIGMGIVDLALEAAARPITRLI